MRLKSLTVIIILALFASPVFAQKTDSLPLYKTAGFPAIRLLLPDSAHYFTKSDLDKKKSVLVMLFNPQCSHCQHETEEITNHIDKFKDIQIVMVTSMGFDSMRAFRDRYHLEKYENIVVAFDANFTLISFYSISQLPTLALYNRRKEFMSIFEGGLPIDKLLKSFDN